MWYQKDWFTGSDYYNFRERQISVQELCIINPVEQVFHERTEIYYVRSGKATIWVSSSASSSVVEVNPRALPKAVAMSMIVYTPSI